MKSLIVILNLGVCLWLFAHGCLAQSPAESPTSAASSYSGLRVVFQWKYIEWDKRSLELTGKNFTLGNAFTQDVDIDRRGRIFVTTPRWLEGNPITLSLLTNLEGSGGPLLTPYPDASWHKAGDCEGIVHVFRVAIDECDRLWVVDDGRATGQTCPSKILIFDLRTDRLLHKYLIPKEQLAANSQLVNPIVEVGYRCLDTHVYVADVLGHGLFIYNLKDNRSWRLPNTEGNAFGPDTPQMNITIVGETMTLTDGILGISLSPPGFFDKRYLYYNALASFYQRFTSVDELKRSEKEEPTYYQSINKRLSQTGAQTISRTGAIFFQLAELTAVACWNIQKPFNDNNIVILALDEENLQYVSNMKIITNVHGEEELWFNTNRLQKTINNSRKLDEINYRFIQGKVKDLIKGTACEYAGYRGPAPDERTWKKL